MSFIDFTEIVSADEFELFAREFLDQFGLKIVEDPSRGPDGGKDLIAVEIVSGLHTSLEKRWLVSCKHYADSNKSVGTSDEINIADRLKQHNCEGFIGFYSTLTSTPLYNRLKEICGDNFKIYDHIRIESTILNSIRYENLFKQFFYNSFVKFSDENPKPAKIFSDNNVLKCDNCGKNLFDNPELSIVTLYFDYSKKPKKYEYVYACCKGSCDEAIRLSHSKSNLISAWEDISDFMNPTVYVYRIIGIINGLASGSSYSEDALSRLKDVLIQCYPFVCRKLSDKEREHIADLRVIPSYLGGLGE